MKRLAISIALIASFLTGFSQINGVLLPAKDGSLWGYINTEGEWKIPARFDRCLPFENRDYTSVVLNGASILINKEGEKISDLPINQISEIVDDFLIFREGNLKGVMHKNGSKICSAKYQSIQFNSFARLFFIESTQGMGTMDEKGNVLISPIHPNLSYETGYIFVFDSTFTGLFSVQGAEIIPMKFKDVIPRQDFIYTVDTSGKHAVYETNGRLIAGGDYFKISRINSTYLVLDCYEHDVLYDLNKRSIVDSSRFRYYAFDENYLLTSGEEGLFGMMDGNTLEQIYQDEYEQIELLENSRGLKLLKDGRTALADFSGTILTPFIYDDLDVSSSNEPIVSRSGRFYGLLSPSGKTMLHPRFSYLAIGDDRIIKAKIDTGVTLYEYNSQFRLIDSLHFESLATIQLGGIISMDFNGFNNGVQRSAVNRFWFRDENGKWGLRNALGKIVISPSFSDILKVPGTDYVLGINYSSKLIHRSRTFNVLYRRAYTLINEVNPKIVSSINSAYIDTAMIRDPSVGVIRGLNNKGYAYLIIKSTEKPRYFNSKYIGKYSNGRAKIFLGNRIMFVNKELQAMKHILGLDSYVSEFNLRKQQTRRERRDAPYQMIGEGFWAYVDSRGNYIREVKFFKDLNIEVPGDFINNRAIIQAKGLYAMVDGEMEYILPLEYSSISYLPNTNNSYLKTIRATSTFGFLSLDGTINITPLYAKVNKFSNGYVWVHHNNRTMLLNGKGEEIIDLEGYHVTVPYAFGFTSFKTQYRYAMVDSTGYNLTGFSFSKAYPMSEGYMLIGSKGGYGYLRPNGRFAISPTFSKALPFSQGLAAVKQGKRKVERTGKMKRYNNPKWGYIDKTGNWVIKARYDEAFSFNIHGFAQVKVRGKLGVIDMQGNFLIRPQFKKIYVSDGRIVGLTHKHLEIYTFEGKKLEKIHGTCKSGYSDEALVVRMNNGKYGAVDLSGNWLLKPEYSKLYPFENGYTISQKATKCYVFNKQGDTIGTAEGRVESGFNNQVALLYRNGEILVYQ